jgi:hypothetical protein
LQTQALPEHEALDPQLLPQRPQLPALTRRSISQPSNQLLLQLAQFVTQVHVPELHWALAPQLLLHDPQFVLLVRRLISQPSNQLLLQLP